MCPHSETRTVLDSPASFSSAFPYNFGELRTFLEKLSETGVAESALWTKRPTLALEAALGYAGDGRDEGLDLYEEGRRRESTEPSSSLLLLFFFSCFFAASSSFSNI